MSMQRVLLLGVLLALAGCVSEPVGSAAEVLPAAATTVVVEMKTSKGDILLELDAQKAPETVRNFVAYARDGFYDGTVFHRVIEGFMIQGGGFTPELREKTTRPPIRNEADNGLRNARGTIAMARTAKVDSATSQFFINHRDNHFLDYRAPNASQFGYAVFGRVVRGMEVVDAIAKVPTCTRGFYENVPRQGVVIEKVSVRE